MFTAAGGKVSPLKHGGVTVGWRPRGSILREVPALTLEGCTPSGEVKVNVFVASAGPGGRKGTGKREMCLTSRTYKLSSLGGGNHGDRSLGLGFSEVSFNGLDMSVISCSGWST